MIECCSMRSSAFVGCRKQIGRHAARSPIRPSASAAIRRFAAVSLSSKFSLTFAGSVGIAVQADRLQGYVPDAVRRHLSSYFSYARLRRPCFRFARVSTCASSAAVCGSQLTAIVLDRIQLRLMSSRKNACNLSNSATDEFATGSLPHGRSDVSRATSKVVRAFAWSKRFVVRADHRGFAHQLFARGRCRPAHPASTVATSGSRACTSRRCR